MTFRKDGTRKGYNVDIMALFETGLYKVSENPNYFILSKSFYIFSFGRLMYDRMVVPYLQLLKCCPDIKRQYHIDKSFGPFKPLDRPFLIHIWLYIANNLLWNKCCPVVRLYILYIRIYRMRVDLSSA